MAGQWDRLIALSSTTPYIPGILMYKMSMPLSTHTKPRGTSYGLQSRQACVPLQTLPPLAQRGSWNVWAVKNSKAWVELWMLVFTVVKMECYPPHHNVSQVLCFAKVWWGPSWRDANSLPFWGRMSPPVMRWKWWRHRLSYSLRWSLGWTGGQ